jgi:hypothetical protein
LTLYANQPNDRTSKANKEKNKMDQLAKELAETFQAKCYDKETACEYMGKQQWQYDFVIKVLGYM